MKPNFALSLSFDSIRLLHRVSSGWRLVGTVATDSDDLPGALSELRAQALALDPAGLACKLLLPPEQIKYLTIETPEADSTARRKAAAAALEGATPYAVADLVFDTGTEGPQTHVAAVARETLEEAEAFAVEHDFAPVSFATVPPAGQFGTEPFFGPTEAAHRAGVAADLVPDSEIVTEVGPVDSAEVVAPAPQETAPAAAATTAPDAARKPETPAPSAPAPAAAPATAETAEEKPAAPPETPRPTATEPTKTGYENARTIAPAVAPEETPETQDTETAPVPPAVPVAKSDPAPQSTADTPAPAVAAPDDVTTKDGPTAPHAPAVPVAKPAADAASAPPEARTKDPEPATGKVPPAAKVAPLPPIENSEPETPVMPRLGGARRQDSPAAAPAAPQLGAAPATGFASRRGGPDSARVEPKPASGPIPAAPGTVVPPLTAPGPAPKTSTPAVVPPPDSTSLDADDSTDAPLDSAPASGSTAAQTPAFGRRGGFLSRRRKGRKAPPPPVITAAPPGHSLRPPRSEAEQMTIFGARRQQVGGKPRHLGLILTAALLLFLAGVAAWAAVFLDDGMRLSQLFGSRATPEVAALPQDDDATSTVVTLAPEAEAEAPAPPRREAALDPTLSEEDSAVLDALREPAVVPELSLDTPLATEALTQAEIDAKYAATGIWTRAPLPPPAPDAGAAGTGAGVTTDDLYITGIDPVSSAADAIALPAVSAFATDAAYAAVANPAAAGTRYALDARGLVTPSAEGTLSPEGITVYRGAPPATPPAAILARLETSEETQAETDAVPVLNLALARLRPEPRPEDLVEQAERAALDGLTRNELAALRPKLRPDAVTEAAAAAAAVVTVTPEDTAAAVTAALTPPPTPATPPAFEDATRLAAKASIRPDLRPRNFGRIVKRAERQESRVASAAAVAPRTVKPKIPTRTSVSRQATTKNAINLRRINLIGVYGKPSNRRALVRLGNGRYRKVEVGDRLDGGKVSAIGDSELRYSKRGRAYVLKMP